MTCPKCNNKTGVKCSRENDGVIYRQRECKSCGYIFYTSEMEDSKKLFVEAATKNRENNRKKCKQ